MILKSCSLECTVYIGNHMYINFSLQTLLKFGKLDILVSNAAVNPSFGPTLEVLNFMLVCVVLPF